MNGKEVDDCLKITQDSVKIRLVGKKERYIKEPNGKWVQIEHKGHFSVGSATVNNHYDRITKIDPETGKVI